MYYEQLMTPHPERLKVGEVQRPLAEAIDFKSAQDALTATEGSPLYATLVFDAATEVALHVHKTLQTRRGVGAEFTPDNLAATPSVNCHGHTVILSECLSEAQIPHVVGVANGHSFAVATDLKIFAMMVDAQSPRLNGDMRLAISETLFSTGEDQIKKYGRAIVRFFSERYVVRSLRPETPFDSLSQLHPWLSPKPGRLDQRVFEDTPISSRFLLRMILYPPKVGREVLANFLNFNRYTNIGDLEQAYSAMMNMSGLYPDIDPSGDELKLVSSFALKLAQAGDVEKARAVIAAADEGLNIEQAPSQTARLWQPDTLRSVGVQTGNVAMVESAIVGYDSIEPQTYMTRAKAAKARRIKQNLSRD